MSLTGTTVLELHLPNRMVMARQSNGRKAVAIGILRNHVSKYYVKVM